MSKLTKRQKLIADRVENEKLYTLEEAVQILNDLPALKFKESIDIAVNLLIYTPSTVIPIERAVPAMVRTAASRPAAVKSASLVLTISSN